MFLGIMMTYCSMFMLVYNCHQFKQLRLNGVEVHKVWGAISDVDS